MKFIVMVKQLPGWHLAVSKLAEKHLVAINKLIWQHLSEHLATKKLTVKLCIHNIYNMFICIMLRYIKIRYLKKYLILSLLFAPLSLFFTSAYAAEDAKPVFDDRKWVLGWSQFKGAAGTGETVFDEYVLPGENVDNWSELVTIQFFPGLNKSANLDVFESGNKISIMQICPSTQWDSIEQNDNERIWQFTMKNCNGQPDQSELLRAVKTDEGIHLFHYVIKKAPMPDDVKATWMKNLKAIQITNNGKK